MWILTKSRINVCNPFCHLLTDTTRPNWSTNQQSHCWENMWVNTVRWWHSMLSEGLVFITTVIRFLCDRLCFVTYVFLLLLKLMLQIIIWKRSFPNLKQFSVQGLHPLKDSPSKTTKAESFRKTLLTSSAGVKCDGLAFGAFPGCVSRYFTLTSRFLPPRPVKVANYTTWCRHFLSFFLLFWAHKESWDMWGHEGS